MDKRYIAIAAAALAALVLLNRQPAGGESSGGGGGGGMIPFDIPPLGRGSALPTVPPGTVYNITFPGQDAPFSGWDTRFMGQAAPGQGIDNTPGSSPLIIPESKKDSYNAERGTVRFNTPEYSVSPGQSGGIVTQTIASIAPGMTGFLGEDETIVGMQSKKVTWQPSKAQTEARLRSQYQASSQGAGSGSTWASQNREGVLAALASASTKKESVTSSYRASGSYGNTGGGGAITSGQGATWAQYQQRLTQG